MYPRKIVVATRPSKLSLIQTTMAIEWIRKFYPDTVFEIRTFKSTGDKVQDKPLYDIGVKGIFEKEINLAVLRYEADIAVHSLKDLPAEIDPRLELACFLPRDSPFDVLVVPKGRNPSIWTLSPGSVVGTSSLRRRAFLLRARRDLRIEPIRGNVDTRVRKLLEGKYDAIVLAECGIERLRRAGVTLEGIDYARLPLNLVPPAPGQGIIAVVCRGEDTDLLKMLRTISHAETTAEALCERALLRTIRGGCHIPLGCVATCIDKTLRIYAAISDPEGRNVISVEIEGSSQSPEEVGIKAGLALIEKSRNIRELTYSERPISDPSRYSDYGHA